MSKIAQAETALNAKLEALQDPEWDSGDDEDDDEDDNKELVKELNNKSPSKPSNTKQKKNVANVLYLGHLPTHMEETELAGFLKQFGIIDRLRVSRSAKTGKSRGYAFIQMKDAQVAAIVADTLSGYLIMGQKKLVCHVMPPEKVPAGLWNISKKAQRQLQNKNAPPPQELSLGKLKEITSKLVQRERKKREALTKMGIDYDFPGYEASVNKMKPKSVTDEKTKNRDSISSVNSAVSKKSKKNRDSISSVNSAKADNSKSKKRKDSIDSTKAGSSRRKSTDSVTSVNSAGSESASKRRRKGADATSESSKTNKTVSAQKKKSKKGKDRRQSTE